MDIEKRLDLFFEQVKDKPLTATAIINAIKATGNAPELMPFYLAYAKASGADIKTELADLTRAQETARQDKSLKETAASLAEKSGALAAETDQEKRKELIENIRKLTASLGSSAQNKNRIYTAADYLNECLNYDPSKDFTPALFGDIAFTDGTTSYIGARTSRGKTTAMINLAREALDAKRKTVFVTLEMSCKQIMNKLILSTAFSMGIAADKENNPENRRALMSMNPGRDIYTVWKRGDLPGSGANAFRHFVRKAYKAITDAQKNGLFMLYNGRGASEPEIINFITAQGEKGAVILLDYIQKMPPKPGTDSDSFRRVQAISHDVVTAANDTNAVIIAGAQFNRMGGSDGLGDLFDDQSFREAGDIEQDAHNAIGIGWKTDKQGRFYEVLKTREDKKQGTLFDLDFCGEYSYMNHGKQIFRPQGRPSKTKGKNQTNSGNGAEKPNDEETPPRKPKMLTRADIQGIGT
jgi:hypothetical protein